jgi:hypothetical protein
MAENGTRLRNTKLRRLTKLAERHRQLSSSLAKVDAEVTDAIFDARALDPPITKKVLGDLFGVTEAAITQRMKRSGR